MINFEIAAFAVLTALASALALTGVIGWNLAVVWGAFLLFFCLVKFGIWAVRKHDNDKFDRSMAKLRHPSFRPADSDK